jgi:outer membrane protein insertion porin family
MLPLLLAAGLQGLPGAAQDSEVLTKVEVVGAVKQTAETVLFKAGLKPGDDLRNVDLTAVLNKLWATGSFDDIKFEVEDEKDGKRLIIRVTERPLIKEVDYRGGTELGLSSMKDKIKEKKLTINPDTVYDPESARKIKDLLVDQAAEKGFRNPTITVSLETMAPGASRLVFDIKEGGKVRIYKITFRGNKAIGSGTLKSAMAKTRTHWSFSWLTSHDLLVDKNLEDDLANLKKLYWRKGYKDVFVGKPTIVVDDVTTAKQKVKNIKREKEAKSPKYDLRATLNIPILEGETYSEGTLKIEGNDKVFKGAKGEEFYRTKIAEIRRDNRSWLAKFLNMRPSIEDLPADKVRPFDLDALNQGVDKIREAYSNQGYIMFKADKKLEVREEHGVKKVDVTLKVDEGELYTVRRINFEGNTTTKDKVLRRSMIIKEGDPFQTELFKDSFTGLGQLGFFDVKTSEPKVDLVPDKPQVDITIKGEESGVNELLFQGGYGSVFGFSLGASFSTKNLGGGGETLSVSYNGGKYQRSATVAFNEPFIFDMPYSFGASIQNSSTDYDASRVGAAYAYQQFSRGISVSLGTRLSTFFPGHTWAWFTSYGTGYSFRIIRIEGGRNYYFRDTSPQLTSTFNQNLTYSTVNHPFKPTHGTKLSLGFEYGGWQFGTDKPFYRTTLEFEKVTSITDRHIFLLNTSYGFVRNLSSAGLPIWDLYRPGGETSIRGYRYGQVGSVLLDNTGLPVVIGGNKQFILNLEYQFKIAEQFRTVFFYDMGNAWAQGIKIFSESPRRSAGVEFRFFLPISPAPLRLIWSRKLNPYAFDTEAKTDFQFSIGTTF